MLQSLETRACENETGKHKEHQGEAATPPGAGRWEPARARSRTKSVLGSGKGSWVAGTEGRRKPLGEGG